jgi:hypothetical protein
MSDNTPSTEFRSRRISVLMDEEISDEMLACAPKRPANAASASRMKVGGARRDRTDDLMLAKHALSQLSYGPLACYGQANQSRERTENGGPGKI